MIQIPICPVLSNLLKVRIPDNVPVYLWQEGTHEAPKEDVYLMYVYLSWFKYKLVRVDPVDATIGEITVRRMCSYLRNQLRAAGVEVD